MSGEWDLVVGVKRMTWPYCVTSSLTTNGCISFGSRKEGSSHLSPSLLKNVQNLSCDKYFLSATRAEFPVFDFVSTPMVKVKREAVRAVKASW